MDIANRRWSEEEFLAMRQEVLRGWPTGSEVDLDEAIAYHKRLPPEKSYHKVLMKAKKEGRILISILVGHALLEECIRDLRLCAAAGADCAYLPGGAYTRSAKYELTQSAIERSRKAGGSLLSEYPIVNHGVAGQRRLVEDPLGLCISGQGAGQECVRHAACLATEITLAGGVTNAALHDLHDLVQHCKSFPFDQRIHDNQYVARLLAYYEEHGVPMAALLWGNGTGWNPPGILIAMEMIQCLLAAEQGVKHLILELSCQGNLLQDVAAWRALRELAREYLERFGYSNIELSVAGRSWMGAWPRDEYRAAGLVAWFAAEAALVPVDDIYLKSVREAITTPMEQANPKAIKIAKQLLDTLKGQRLTESEELRVEQEMIKMEVRAIVDKVIELGNGDPLKGQMRAVEVGVLDIPFSAWDLVKGKVLPVRDASGAMRYFDHGNLPFPEEIVRYHREKIREREKREGIKADMKMVADDITYLSKEMFPPARR